MSTEMTEAADLVLSWSNNLEKESRLGKVHIFNPPMEVDLTDECKLYAAHILANVQYELRRRAGGSK